MSLLSRTEYAGREEYALKIEGILEAEIMGDLPDSFDSSFVGEMQDVLQSTGILTPKQEQAIDNIINGFNIDY